MTIEAPTSLEDDIQTDHRRTVLLVIGDAIVFLIFAAIGRGSHKEAVGIASTIGTAVPFALGWFLIAPLIGAYHRRQTMGMRKMAKWTALSWIAAWPVAILIRGIFVDHAVPPWTFMLISFLANLLFLEIWRILFSWLHRR